MFALLTHDGADSAEHDAALFEVVSTFERAFALLVGPAIVLAAVVVRVGQCQGQAGDVMGQSGWS